MSKEQSYNHATCDHCHYSGFYNTEKDDKRCASCGRLRKQSPIGAIKVDIDAEAFSEKVVNKLKEVFKTFGYGPKEETKNGFHVCSECNRLAPFHYQGCKKLRAEILNTDTIGGIANTTTTTTTESRKELVIPADAALVFIQRKGQRFPIIYQDGKELKGVRSITIRAGVDDITTHEVEFLTGFTE